MTVAAMISLSGIEPVLAKTSNQGTLRVGLSSDLGDKLLLNYEHSACEDRQANGDRHELWVIMSVPWALNESSHT